ncbi:Ribulose bisphosphate carboxylase large chain [Savitreella phatthalungensis]
MSDTASTEVKRSSFLVGRPLLYFTSCFVSLGCFLFGFDQGVMSALIPNPWFKDFFDQPSSTEIGTMVSVLEIGALISSLAVGRIGDILGRKRTIFWGAVIFVIGGALQTFCPTYNVMIAGRVVAGLGVGMLSTIVPVYQSEISPAHDRGRLACIEFTGNIIGYASSVWIDYACSYIESDYSWRLPLLMQCVMGGILAIGATVIPESPRWLLDHNHDEEGMIVLANFYGGGDPRNDMARSEFRDIKETVIQMHAEGERSYAEMFRRYKTRLFIAMSSQAFAQLNGINVISYYCPLVFEQAGWVGRDAILMTGFNGLIYVASTILPWYVIDSWGRRPILLSGAIIMCISLSAIAYFIKIDVSYTPTFVVGLVIIYNAAFGYSWGPVPWLLPSEVLPLSVRARGASLSTAVNWLTNWYIGISTPILQERIGFWLYIILALSCAVSAVVVAMFYPETKGLALEDMDDLFGDQSVAPTPRGAESQSLFDAGERDSEANVTGAANQLGAAEPPDDEQILKYLQEQSRRTDLSAIFDRLRGVQQQQQSTDNSDGPASPDERSSLLAHDRSK